MNDTILLILTVPVITAFVGWVTNWAAVKMIFYPEKFVGVGPLGWQGILPRQAHKFATGVADMATENLISARELAERLDPKEMEKLFADTLHEQTEIIIHKVADEVRPGAWEELPDNVKMMVIQQVQVQTRQLAFELFDQLQGISEELLDLHKLVYTSLSGDNVNRLSRFTKKIGEKEFKFIEYYGGVFGFLIGMVQVLVWSLMQTWWLMPIVGAAVGLVTNWLAIQMIFRPLEPTKYAGVITYQGMFPKRQPEIAHDYGTVAADEILTPRNLIRLLSEGEAGEKITKVVTDAISHKIDTEYQKFKFMLPIEVTPEQLERIKVSIAAHISDTVPEIQPELEEYLEKKLDVANTVETKLTELPKVDFERILRGIFEEDEIILIMVGGFLGFAIGIVQGILVLSLNL